MRAEGLRQIGSARGLHSYGRFNIPQMVRIQAASGNLFISACGRSNLHILVSIGHHDNRPKLVVGFATKAAIMGWDRNRVRILSSDGVEDWQGELRKWWERRASEGLQLKCPSSPAPRRTRK